MYQLTTPDGLMNYELADNRNLIHSLRRIRPSLNQFCRRTVHVKGSRIRRDQVLDVTFLYGIRKPALPGILSGTRRLAAGVHGLELSTKWRRKHRGTSRGNIHIARVTT